MANNPLPPVPTPPEPHGDSGTGEPSTSKGFSNPVWARWLGLLRDLVNRLGLLTVSSAGDLTAPGTVTAKEFIANSAATAGVAGTIHYGATVSATVGAAGGAAALPATPLGYIIANVAGTQVKIPYYNN